ncbi:MAG: 50S ribosomal protein L17 [Candidatus Binatia bacterium]|jgi:large subunit ribosomal protein L17|nr:50S ribosomal protein L17 [Candidatus Binatia bacterium]
MRHLKKGRKLNRSPSHRLALMRNLVTSLLRHGRIETTVPKAKELRRWTDWMIGLGKEGTLHARRRALAVIQDKAVVRELFEKLAPRFKDRPGGYTRAVKVGLRRGDSAPLSVIELIPEAVGDQTEAAPAGRRRRRQARTKAEPEAAQ